MNNYGVLLETKIDPPDLDGARDWYQRAADAGNTDAMNNYGVLLATRLDPPDLAGARDWYQRAADAGNTDAMLSLGSLNLRGFDVEGAARAWQPILEDGPSELAAVASVNLAPIFAVTGQLIQAVATLQVAAVFGAQQQGRCIAVRLVR